VRVTDFSVERPVTISMIVMIVVVVGVIALSKLGMDLMPDIDYPTLSIMVRYPGAQSEELETVVAKPYEGAISSVTGVKKVQTISQEDVCYILVDFIWGTDLDAAAADIREAVSWLEPYMPQDVEAPVVIKFSLSSMPLAAYSVTGMEDTVELKRMMEDSVQNRLERLEGVAQAMFFGGREREVQVLLDRAAMSGTGVTSDQVMMALAYQNLNMPAGRIIHDRQELLLRTVGVFDDLRDIRGTAVGMSRTTGAPIRLDAISDVVWTVRDVRNKVRANGMDAVMFMVQKESGANPLQVRRAYLGELEEIKETLPPEIRMDMLFDMGRVIVKLGRAVVQNGLIGALLAVVVMYMFLRNARPTATIAVVIPLSLLATFIPIYVSGDTLNMMTMGGLVLGIGMLVDNAVVVIENIYRHLEGGRSRVDAAKLGAREVGTAIVASTLTTVVVFLPIVFGGGLAARMARGLALTVAAALFCSLFVALTIVPMLASVFFSRAGIQKSLKEGRFFFRFRAAYRALLSWCLHHRYVTSVLIGVLIFLSLVVTAPFVGAEFMPKSDTPLVMLKVSFPVGTSMDETDAACRRVEAVLRQFPDVATVGTSLGADENDPTAGMSPTNPAGVHEAIVFVRLLDKEDREHKSMDDILEAFRKNMPVVENMDTEFFDMGSAMGDTAAPVDIKLYGQDLEELRQWSDLIAERITGLPGIQDVDTTLRAAKPERHITIDRDKAASYGLTVGQVAGAVKTATLGTVATRYREKGDEYDVRLRYAEQFRDTEDAMRQILVPLPMGGAIPLGQIATLDRGAGPVKITRENQTRRVSVTANVEGTNLGAAMKEVTGVVTPLKSQMPPGYTIEYGGEYEDMMTAFGQLILALILAVLLVYMVMASQFESFAHPFTIMATMPLALVGVLWIFVITGTPLSVASFIGVIMLAGIVVNNGIVMIDYINQLRKQGMDILEATLEGATTRLRPVMITSMTTIFAMIPMAVSKTEGSETMAPLALTVIGGLAAATVFTLLAVPVAYIMVDRAAALGARAWMWVFQREELRQKGG